VQTVDPQINALAIEVDNSIRYHNRRRAFFEWLHRSSMFLVILLGLAAMAKWFSTLSGLITTVIGTANLVVGFGSRARDHQILAQRFSELLRRIRVAYNPTESDVRAWRDDKLEIDADEPSFGHSRRSLTRRARRWPRCLT
jgi:hypothetical protein